MQPEAQQPTPVDAGGAVPSSRPASAPILPVASLAAGPPPAAPDLRRVPDPVPLIGLPAPRRSSKWTRGLIAVAIVGVWFLVAPPWRSGLLPPRDPWLTTAPYPAQVIAVRPGGVVELTSHAYGVETVTLAAIHCPNPRADEYWAPAATVLSDYRGQWMQVTPVRRGPGGVALASLLQATGERLEVSLVRAGWCRWDRSTAPGDKELARAEREAQEARAPYWRRAARSPRPAGPR